MTKEIVSVNWLHEHLYDEHLIVLDSSPTATATGKVSVHDAWCIPHARLFDIKGSFTDKASRFPNTVPASQQFEIACRALGINSNSKIVVYDNFGVYTSPRVWWLFKIMGHEQVSVLNGGLGAWIKEGYDTVKKTDIKPTYELGDFKCHFSEQYVINHQQILKNIQRETFTVVDARSAGRFHGTAPEPRKELKSGNIPNSINIPYQLLLKDGKFKSKAALRTIFKDKLDESARVVFSCGSGMTACIVMLASEIAFKKNRFLYDGSWTEYASLQQLLTDEQ